MKLNIIYITAGGMDEARAIGKALVSTRLAACVNILDNMNSFYWWEGEIQDDKEVVLIAKTRESLVSQLIEKVRSMHSYDCPCIVSIPVADGNPAFLEWIVQETRET
jgi:periplasmic divalent cation tolerance protein